MSNGYTLELTLKKGKSDLVFLHTNTAPLCMLFNGKAWRISEDEPEEVDLVAELIKLAGELDKENET